MVQRGLWLALWSTLARWLRVWADLMEQQARKAERRAVGGGRGEPEAPAEADAGGPPVDTAAAAEPPAGPPAQWVERVAGSGPPEHWLEHIRERAPQILDGDHLAVEPLHADASVVEKTPSSARARPAFTEPRQARATMTRRQARPSPLRLIPRPQPKPAAEAAMEAAAEVTVEASLPEPVAREGRGDMRTATAIRLQPQSAESAVLREPPIRERQDKLPAPAQSPPARPQRLPKPEKEVTVQRPRPRRPAESPRPPAARPVPEAPLPPLEAETPAHIPPPAASPRPAIEVTVPCLDVEAPLRPPLPTASPSVASRRPREPQPGPIRRTSQREPVSREPEPGPEQVGGQAQPARRIAVETGHLPAAPVLNTRSAPAPVLAPEPPPRAEKDQAEAPPTRPWPASEWQGIYGPQDRERWPALPDEAPLFVESPATGDWAGYWRDWQRLQRLDREQRGCLWSESPF